MFRLLFCAFSVDLWFLGAFKLRAKPLLKFNGDLTQCRAVFQIYFFHHGGKFENIAFSAAAETLENPFVQILRKTTANSSAHCDAVGDTGRDAECPCVSLRLCNVEVLLQN